MALVERVNVGKLDVRLLNKVHGLMVVRVILLVNSFLGFSGVEGTLKVCVGVCVDVK